MKIVLVITRLLRGGAETQVKSLAQEFVKKDTVMVVSLMAPKAYAEELKKSGVYVVSLNMTKSPKCLMNLIKGVIEIRRFKPDVIHAHSYHSNIFARLVRYMINPKTLICTAHNTYERPTKTTVIREVTVREYMYRFTDWLCDHTTQITTIGLDRYRAVKAFPKKKSSIVGNGVSLEAYYPSNDIRNSLRGTLSIKSEFVWVAVGRLDNAKNFTNMITAFKNINSSFPTAKLFIVGDGPLKESLQQKIDELSLGGVVALLGLRNDVSDLMKMADAYLMSSDWEGLPLVLQEAAASELPIVATDVGGNKEIVMHGVNGYLVPKNDHNVLAQSAVRVMSMTDSERGTLGKSGRALMLKKFSMDTIIKKWYRLYDDCI